MGLKSGNQELKETNSQQKKQKESSLLSLNTAMQEMREEHNSVIENLKKEHEADLEKKDKKINEMKTTVDNIKNDSLPKKEKEIAELTTLLETENLKWQQEMEILQKKLIQKE